jgi:hypothetical protein
VTEPATKSRRKPKESKPQSEAEPPRVKVDPTKPRLTAGMCARLHWLRTRRHSLEAEARAIAAEEGPIADCALAWMEANGVTNAKRGEFIAAEKLGNAYPKWKDAFIAECGSDKAKAVAEEAIRAVSVEVRIAK